MFANLLCVGDTRNSLLRVINISRLVSRKKYHSPGFSSSSSSRTFWRRQHPNWYKIYCYVVFITRFYSWFSAWKLSEVDKFSYLRGLLEEQAKAAIGGFSITGPIYQAVMALLKRHFGKKTVVQREHMAELMKTSVVYSERDTARENLLWPYSICTGRKLLHNYPGVFIGNTTQTIIFKVMHVAIDNQSSKGRLHKLYHGVSLLPLSLGFFKNSCLLQTGMKRNLPS